MECPRWCSKCDWQGYDECPCKSTEDDLLVFKGQKYTEDENESNAVCSDRNS